jgi:hypothetical protein
VKRIYHNVRSRPLLEKLNCSNANSEYGEDCLDGAEDQSGVHGCQMEYSVIVGTAAGRESDSFSQEFLKNNGQYTMVITDPLDDRRSPRPGLSEDDNSVSPRQKSRRFIANRGRESSTILR